MCIRKQINEELLKKWFFFQFNCKQIMKAINISHCKNRRLVGKRWMSTLTGITCQIKLLRTRRSPWPTSSGTTCFPAARTTNWNSFNVLHNICMHHRISKDYSCLVNRYVCASMCEYKDIYLNSWWRLLVAC